jgi:hypothetical protein
MSTSAPSQPTSGRRGEMLRSSRPRPRGADRRSVSRAGRSLLLAPVLALAVGLSAACADDAGPAVPNLPPIPTALPSGLPTSIPTSVPTKAPAGEPQGDVVSAMGALLAPSNEAVQSDAGPDAPCQNIIDSGWAQDDCGIAGSYLWFVERNGAVGEAGTGWQAFLASFDTARGAWVKVLKYADPSGESVTSVTGRTAALSSGDGDAVFAFRNQGTGDILSYDIVGTGGDPVVLAHREISHGEATLDGSSILDTEAEYPNGEPNCCPAYFQLSRVSWNDSRGAFVVSPVAQQGEPNQGDF